MRRHAAVFFLLLLAACGSDTDSDPRFVRIAISSNPKSLDPALTTDVNGGDIAAKVFNGLVRFEGLEVRPDLSDTWRISVDGLNYQFHVRPGVRFHNGREVAAEDVIHSFARILDPIVKSQRKWVFDAVDTFFVNRAGDVEIRLKRPSAPFLSLLAMPSGYVVPIEEARKYGEDFSRHVVGTGPYKLSRWEDDRSVVLLRNDDYFEGAPSAMGVIYRVISEPLTQIALLKRGELDICEVPDAQMPAFQKDAKWSMRMQSADQLVSGYVAINTERFPDPRVRRAFNMAVNIPRVIASVRNGLATVSAGPVPPALIEGGDSGFQHDPAAARKLLEDAGFDFSREVVLLRNAPRGTLEPAEAVAGYLRDIGIKAVVEPMEFSSLIARLNRSDYDLCLLNWFADYADAENFLLPLFHSKNIGSSGNRSRINDPEVDSAVMAVVEAPPGPRREELIGACQALIVSKAPWIFLWHPRTAIAVAPRISGYAIPMIYNGFKGEKLVIAQ